MDQSFQMYEGREAELQKEMVRMTKYSMLQLIVRRQIRCTQVLSWPIFLSLMSVTLFLFYEASPSLHSGIPPWIIAAFLCGAFFLVILIAIDEAKTITIRTVMRLEEFPQEQWFDVISVEQREPRQVSVGVRDFFGKFTKLNTHEYPASVKVPKQSDELGLHKTFVASRLKPQWEGALEKLQKWKEDEPQK